MDIILGTSAEERAKLIYEKAVKLSQDEKNKILIIVPEQYTLETQKGIVKAHPRHAIMNIDVVSFNRLAYKVLDKTGSENLPMIRETGKNMIVRKLLNSPDLKLKFFSSGLRKRGFVSDMKSLLSELDQYACTSGELQTIAEELRISGSRRMSDKLSDIARFFDAYKRELSTRFYTCEDLLTALNNRLEESSFLSGAHVFFDGFTGFTVSQYKIIETIIKKAENTCFSFCYEGDELHPESTSADSGNLFFMTDNCIKRLKELNALYGHSDVNVQAGSGAFSKQRAPELDFLHHSFFSDPVHKSLKKRTVFTGEVKVVKILEADDIKEEISLIIGKIRRLITEEGYRYRDIAVVMEDIESYGDITFKLLRQNGFPVFLDRTKSVNVNPFIENIRAFLKLITDGFSYENVFRYIKCGFSPVPAHLSDELDNYCLATGIKNESGWKKEWKRIPGKKKTTKEGEIKPYYDLEELNVIRKAFYEHVSEFRDRLKAAEGVSQKLDVITGFLDKKEVTERTFALFGSELGEETRQTVKKTGELFRETRSLFGDEKMNTAELADMLDAAFEEMSAGFIPPSNDCIIIGDTDRTRLQNIKALFIAGVNDGVIPKRNASRGILSDGDRLRLAGAGLELAPSVREQAFIQRFYLYLLLTKPFERLYLSYSRRDLQGESLSASYLINDMLKAFSELSVEPAKERDISLSRLGLVKTPEIWTPGKEEILLTASAVDALYAGEITGSISSFESFAGCPFTYYLKKGLNIYPRERYEFDPADFGTIVHDILYRVLKLSTDKGIKIESISRAGREAMVEEQLKEAAKDYYILSDTERNGFVRYRIKQIAQATLAAVGYQISGGDFVPHGFEKRFSKEMAADGGRLKFSGIIDRSDISVGANEVYFRVIDYKTGHNEFSLNKFIYGRQLQLVSYLNAVHEELAALYPGKNIIPSGMLYMMAKNPFAKEEGHKLSDAQIAEEITSELSMKGVLTDDDMSLIKNDTGGRGDIIENLKFKDGTPSPAPRHTRVSREQMEDLQSYAVFKTKDIAAEILKGEASVSPLEEPGSVRRPICEYCDYVSVCNYNPDLARSKRVMRKCSEEEMWECVRQ